MAVQQIDFKQKGAIYESDGFKPTADNIVVRVVFKQPGLCELHRSIDGIEPYVYAFQFTSKFPANKIEERNISGIKSGQFLKLVFKHSEPEKILLME